jgi:hypothetical protein
MNPDEVTLAMEAFRSAYPYVPLADVQARQFKRLFSAYQVEPVRSVIDDLIRLGFKRPGPAELGEMIRTKSGASPAGQRVHRDGPYLEDIRLEDCPPTEAIPSLVDELRVHLKAKDVFVSDERGGRWA